MSDDGEDWKSMLMNDLEGLPARSTLGEFGDPPIMVGYLVESQIGFIQIQIQL